MTLIEFKSVFDDFNDNYNNGYTLRHSDKLYAFVRWIRKDEFKKGLEEIMDDQIKAPPLTKILGHFREAVNRCRLIYSQELIKSQPQCDYCLKTGIIDVYEKKPTFGVNPHLFSFICPHCQCASILGLAQDIPRWESKHFSNFVLLIEDLGKKSSKLAIKSKKDDLISELCESLKTVK
jgi:hypothetical protein